MSSLKLNDIREWLIDNRSEYQKLKAQEFPPVGNVLYWMYSQIHEFIQYYPLIHRCDKALKDLEPLLNNSFSQIINWTQINEILGSQELILFEIDYINCDEGASDESIKIYEGIYTERKPFANIICFCKVFQFLYWDNCIHKTLLTEEHQLIIKKKVRRIFRKYYFDKKHE